MNAIRKFTQLSLGGYRSYRGTVSTRRSQPQRRNGIQSESFVEEFDLNALEDPEDLESHQSNMKNVGQYDKINERELEIEKAKLKTQIVKRKYFSTKEPAMLTWGEKEQIRFLHSKDPEEWTPDKLSESFPASREGILKVVRSTWVPKDVKVVEKYEQIVKDNWSRLKAGKLVVDPRLKEHLEKFKNREITPMDRERIAKKIIKPIPVFKNPESTLFSSIMEGYRDVNSNEESDDEDCPKSLPDKKFKTFLEITSSGEQKMAPTKLAVDREIRRKEMLTVDEFLHKRVDSVEEDNMTPIDRVIIDETKRQSTEAYKKGSLLMFKSESAVAAWNDSDGKNEEQISVKNLTKYENLAAPAIKEEKKTQLDTTRVLEGSLETGIISREKKADAKSNDYPQFIQIPRKKYKFGASYRIDDRYYDTDGELLYRVPGLKS